MKTSPLFAVSVLTILALGTLSTNAQATSACYLPGACGSVNGAGVLGDSSSTNGEGVQGGATGPGGNGVVGLYGSATVNASYANSGVYGASDTNNGVVGTTTSTADSGVAGINTGTMNNSIGVYGYTGNRSSGYAGYFDGNVKVTGTLTCGSGCSSDKRLKKDIEPLKGAIDRLLQLKGVTFAWKNPEEHENHIGTQIGVIAQDVEKVFPQWVRENEKGFKNVDPDARTTLALTVEGFRELRAENDELKARVKALESARRPAISMNANGIGVGVAGMALAGAFIVGRRRKQTQERP